jgi:hypothetical protein
MFDFAFGAGQKFVERVNNLADTQAQAIEVKKAELKKEIAQAQAPSSASTTTTIAGTGVQKIQPVQTKNGFELPTPIKSVYLFLLTILSFILENKTLLYIIMAFLAYKILRFIITRISEWRNSKPSYNPQKPKI